LSKGGANWGTSACCPLLDSNSLLTANFTENFQKIVVSATSETPASAPLRSKNRKFPNDPNREFFRRSREMSGKRGTGSDRRSERRDRSQVCPLYPRKRAATQEHRSLWSLADICSAQAHVRFNGVIGKTACGYDVGLVSSKAGTVLAY